MKKNQDIIYNKNYLVIVPQMSVEYLEAFEYTFKNVILMKNDIDSINETTKFINENNFQQLIFVDYQTEFERVFLDINKKPDMKYIFTSSLGSLSDEFVYTVFNNIYDNYKKGKISSIGFLDKGMYETFKKKGDNVFYVLLDTQEKPKKENNNQTIGILNNEHLDTNSFYNELSAIKLTNKYKARIVKESKILNNFIKLFNIEIIKEKNVNNIIDKNIINLNINFTSTNYINFFKSMDLGIPCILGNTNLLDSNEYLKKMLIVESDDNVNIIKDKILNAIKNKEQILKEYEKFRNKYSNEVIGFAEEFLNNRIEKTKQEKEYEYLITIVVPVYNTSKYLENSLNSILNAITDYTEILIINDGSTDESDKIIKRYEKNFPDIIRYIKQENHGLGNVRNVGLKEAKGKYIASIDSDDTIDFRFFIEALPYLKQNVDIVICDWMSITDETKYETAAIDWIFKDRNKYEGLLYTSIMPSTCNKIIKKELFDELNLTYLEDKYEDLSTNPFVLLKADTIKYINKPYYEYYIRSNSIMRSSAGLSMIKVIKFVDKRVNKYKDIIKIDIDEFKYYTYSWRIEEFVLNQLYTIDEKELKDYIEYIDKEIYNIMINIFDNDLYKKMLNTLNEKNKKYINERNEAIINHNLYSFITKKLKQKEYYKLTAPIIYYGDKNDN